MPDQGMDTVLLREAINLVILVLPDAAWQLGGNAHVERSSGCACKNVNAGYASSVHRLSLASSSTKNEASKRSVVIPANAGIHLDLGAMPGRRSRATSKWIPAFAGMTSDGVMARGQNYDPSKAYSDQR